MTIDNDSSGDLKEKIWAFTFFNAQQRCEQYRHLDGIRERYFSIWIGLATILIAGTLTYSSSPTHNPETFRNLGYAFITLWILGEWFTLMGIQIRSTQNREEIYNTELRREILKTLGQGKGLCAKLARLAAWSELAGNPKVLNYKSSSVMLILAVGELSILILIVGLYLLTSESAPLWVWGLLTAFLILVQFIVIRKYLQYLDKRLDAVVSKVRKIIEEESIDIEKLIEAAQTYPDTN